MAGLIGCADIRKGPALLVLVAFVFLVRLFAKRERWLAFLSANRFSLFKRGFWYEKCPTEVLRRTLWGKCIYPKCEGVVQVVPAPSRGKVEPLVDRQMFR